MSSVETRISPLSAGRMAPGDEIDPLTALDMKGCISHFIKWSIHPFISKETIIIMIACLWCNINYDTKE